MRRSQVSGRRRSAFLVAVALAFWHAVPLASAFDLDAVPLAAPEGPEPFGAEDRSAEDDRPRIPEPMVFDLIRPLGARRGEFEVNTLGLFPLSPVPESRDAIPDALGLDEGGIEWAPEMEYAVRDDFALELEAPFQGATLGAYKGAAQWTFGVDPARQFIHGAQLIVQYDRAPASWLPALLYLAGKRFDEVWSVLGMFGARGNSGTELGGDRVEMIANVSLFADLSGHLTAGLETNFSHTFTGRAALLLMPQLHWEVTDYVMLQTGAGARITSDGTIAEAAVRLVRSF
ncbi:hypothetical protein [Methylotetracoccus oryzae]|uniref:hypothetical protein n=1 Tax=Methylotetracoccus oryzae TaxID=1919059 RepID=UPI00111B3DF2|nr:hypothetical protein [Methylotetracoccus oryzae]